MAIGKIRSADMLQDILRSVHKGEETLPEQTVPAVGAAASAASAASTNRMSRNFASAGFGRSAQVEATLIGRRAEKSMQAKEQNTLVAILRTAGMEYENAQTAGEKYKALRRAERKIGYHQSDEVRKHAERHLRETREDIEDKAREALAPQDEYGNPINLPGTGSGGAAIPEASAPIPAPSPETPPGAAGNSAPPGSPSPAPDTPSLDIVQ